MKYFLLPKLKGCLERLVNLRFLICRYFVSVVLVRLTTKLVIRSLVHFHIARWNMVQRQRYLYKRLKLLVVSSQISPNIHLLRVLVWLLYL